MPHQTSDRSATSHWSGTAASARRRWPRRCCIAAGVTSRPGRVDDGTSVLDREPEEIDRRIDRLAGARLVRLEGGGRQHLPSQPARHARPSRFRGRRQRRARRSPISSSSSSAPSTGSRSAPRSRGTSASTLGLPRMFFVTREDKHRADFDGVARPSCARRLRPWRARRSSCRSARPRRSTVSPTC